MNARQLIADAASTVDGINVTPYFRQVTKQGQGMVRLERMNRSDNGFGFINTWQVIVILPSDMTAAEKYIEDKVNDLIEAISEQLVITSVQPQSILLEGGTFSSLVIEGAREAE